MECSVGDRSSADLCAARCSAAAAACFAARAGAAEAAAAAGAVSLRAVRREAISRTLRRWAIRSSSFSTIGRKSLPESSAFFFSSLTMSSRECTRWAMLMRLSAEASPLIECSSRNRPLSFLRNSASVRAGSLRMALMSCRPVSVLSRKEVSCSGSTCIMPSIMSSWAFALSCDSCSSFARSTLEVMSPTEHSTCLMPFGPITRWKSNCR